MHAPSQSPAASSSATFALARARSAVLSFHVQLLRAFFALADHATVR